MQSNRSERESYVQAGCEYSLTRTVSDDAPGAVQALVKRLRPLQQMPDILREVTPHMHPPMATFVLYGVLDPLLLEMQHDAYCLVSCPGLFELFLQTLDGTCTRDVDHFTCGLLTFVVDRVIETPVLRRLEGYVPRVLQLMERISRLTVIQCEMMRNVELFTVLSKIVSTYDPLPMLMRIVTNAAYYHHTRLTEPVLRAALSRLSSAWLDLDSDPARELLRFVELCVGSNVCLREHMMHEVMGLWRSGWDPRLGRIVACQLDTPSVEFVILLERKNRLDGLLRACANNAHSDATWQTVQARLRRHWPERVDREVAAAAAAPQGVSPPPPVPRTLVDCPITQVPMCDPVVASDGHTYERCALLRHMVHNGAWSPITREALTYHLHPNRALYAT